MDWSTIVVSIVTLIGVFATYLLGNRREDNTRVELWKHEDDVAVREHRYWIKQQWWIEKKVSYASLLEALYHLRAESEADLARVWAQMEGQQIQPKTTSPTAWFQSIEQVRRVAGMGAFTISEEVATVVSDYLKVHERLGDAIENGSMSPLDVEEEATAAINNCIKVVHEAALRDLGVMSQQIGVA
jgi:hypothetical protein